MTEILDQLEINRTFFYQFALFGVFFFVLSGLYLKPFQKLLSDRNQRLKDDVKNAEDLLRAVESRLSDYDRALSQARADALKSYEAGTADARAREDAQIAAVKDELKKEFLKANELLQEEKLKIESELKLQLGPLSDSVVQKVTAGN